MDMASALVMDSAQADPRYTGVYMYEEGGEAPGLGCGRAGLANGDGTDDGGTYGDGDIGHGNGNGYSSTESLDYGDGRVGDGGGDGFSRSVEAG